MSQITTLRSSFADDLCRYADAGPDGIGVSDLAAPADDVLAQAHESFARCWDATRVPTPPSTMKEHR